MPSPLILIIHGLNKPKRKPPYFTTFPKIYQEIFSKSISSFMIEVPMVTIFTIVFFYKVKTRYATIPYYSSKRFCEIKLLLTVVVLKRFLWRGLITVKYRLYCPELGNLPKRFSGALITRIEKALQNKL